MVNDPQTTLKVQLLLEKLGALPEKEVTPDSPVDDFFNTVVKFKDGRRAGALLVSAQSSPRRPLYIELHEGMTHQQLFISLTIGIFTAIALVHTNQRQLTQDHRTVYSYYDGVIRQLRWKLKYVNRRLRHAQRKFHNAEAKFCRMLMAQQTGLGQDPVYAAHAEEVRIKSDYYMDMFTETFALREKLTAEIEANIHADAEGKKSLEGINQAVVN